MSGLNCVLKLVLSLGLLTLIYMQFVLNLALLRTGSHTTKWTILVVYVDRFYKVIQL